MTMKMDVTGLDDLQAMLLSLGTAARQEGALRRAMTDALEPTAERARELVPVRTGNLKRSIVISDRAKGVAKDPDAVTVYLGASQAKGARGRHAHLLEFGTVKMSPRPFLRPAWDQDGDAMLRRLADNLRTQIEAAVKRKGR